MGLGLEPRMSGKAREAENSSVGLGMEGEPEFGAGHRDLFMQHRQGRRSCF